APLRGGRWPSLTADHRLAPKKAGRDGGMVSPIEQRDGPRLALRPPPRQPQPTRISKEAEKSERDTGDTGRAVCDTRYRHRSASNLLALLHLTLGYFRRIVRSESWAEAAMARQGWT